MKNIYLTAIGIIIGQVLCNTAISFAQTDKQVRQIGDFYRAQDGFNGEIILAKDGRIITQIVYGDANKELGIPLSLYSRFRVGSITKQFTAVSILLLQDLKRLKVTDHMSDFIKNSPPGWKDITIEQLLDHTSGIEDDVLASKFPQFFYGSHKTDEIIETVKSLPLKSKPGQKFDYTNIEYIILVKIIENVSKESYGDFLKHHIFEPLGMMDSGLGGPPEVIPKLVSGYEIDNGNFTQAMNADPSVIGAAGAIYSTGRDMIKWIDALQNGRIISASSLREMNARHSQTPYNSAYGYGIFVENHYGQTAIGHGGDLSGFHSQEYYFPATGYEIVILSNVSRVEPKSSPGTYAIINELLKLVCDPKGIRPSTKQKIDLPYKVISSHQGIYTASFTKQRIEIFLKNSSLYMKIVGQDNSETILNPMSATQYYSTNSDIQVEFKYGKMILNDVSHEQQSSWDLTSK